MNDYLTFAEVAGELGCTLKVVRTLVMENKTLRATRITKNGLVLSSCGPEGHFPYDLDLCCHLDDNGEITSDVYERDSTGRTVLLKTLEVGALRIERTDLENFRLEQPPRLAPSCALEVPESKEQRQDNHGSVQTSSVMPEISGSISGGIETASENWKMRIQTEAAAMFQRLRESGASPTVHSILDDLVKWCRANGVKTDGGIYPRAGYLRTHVLGGKHWTPPP